MAKQARQVPKVKVISRHRADCEHKSDKSYTRCTCTKALYWYADGREHIITADTNDYQIAERKASEKQQSFTEPEYVTVEGAVDLYLASKKATGYTEKSLEKLELIFKTRFAAFFAQRGIVYLKDVKRADLETWRATWTGAASTRDKVQGRVIGFFEWAVASDMVMKNPALGLEKIKGGRDVAPTLALTDEQFATVLATIDSLSYRTEDDVERLRSLAMLQRWSGLAIQDALTIERKSFQQDADGWYRLYLRRAKTGVEVYVTLAPEVANEILSVVPVSERYLFWDGKANVTGLTARYQNAFQRVSKDAALKDEHGNAVEFHSHMLRDTFAVWCFTQGMATEDVAALLGHKNITVTQQHYSPWIALRQQRLANIVRDAYTQYAATQPSAALATAPVTAPVQ